MRIWDIKIGSRFKMPLAADSRFCTPDYTNDQIWELNIGEGDPAALAIQTTYGLRVQRQRLFPRFIRKDIDLINPGHFYEPPILKSFYPNYLTLNFSPFKDIKVLAEYWVPSSQVICGRFQLNNQNDSIQAFRFEFVNLLYPFSGGQGTTVVPWKMTQIIHGKAADLEPVLFITGSPKPGLGPFPALSVDIELLPGASRSITWAHAAQPSIIESFNVAFQTTNRNWDAETARIEIVNSSQLIEIFTGNTNWDIAFANSQRTAYSLFFPSSKHFNHPSFVLDRQIDHGHPLRDDGSDYPFTWSGQSPLDAYYLFNLILPGGLELAKGVLQNFLEVQEDNGEIDWKPGIAGQRCHMLATPLLTSLALSINSIHPDNPWLGTIYQGLLNFIKCWLQPEHDKDGDFFPEWQHSLQVGLDESPFFDIWNQNTRGMDISLLETPTILTFLFLECQGLIQIGTLVGEEKDVLWLKKVSNKLIQSIQETFNNEEKTFHYRDFLSHLTLKGEEKISWNGNGNVQVTWSWKQPVRLQVRIKTQGESSRPAIIQIRGENESGEIVETFNPRNFSWANRHAYGTSQNLFLSINKVIIEGLESNDQTWIFTADYLFSDCSLLLPIIYSLPSTEKNEDLINKALLKNTGPHGISLIPVRKHGAEVSMMTGISPLWNLLIIEGLLRSGYQNIAVDLLKRWMDSFSLPQLQINPSGEFFILPVQLSGKSQLLYRLAPVSLFLESLGIHISDGQIIINGLNPYDWPVTVKYRGISITRHSLDSVITFPSGQIITVTGPGPHQISLV